MFSTSSTRITSFGAGYTFTECDDYIDGPCPQEPGVPIPPPECDLTGRRRAGAPRLNLTLFSAYQHTLGFVDFDWFTQVDYQYLSMRYLDTDLDPVLKAPRTSLLGLRAGFRSPEGRWELSAWMKNVTDTDFLVAGFDAECRLKERRCRAEFRHLGRVRE